MKTTDKSVVIFKKAEKLALAKNPDLSQVYHLLNAAADLGNSDANYAIATWYLHGKYFRKDVKKGVSFLLKAIEKDHPSALFDMAICYEKGSGIKRNKRKAFECYLKAFLYGDTKSAFEVGRSYYYGIGISKNKKIAEIWIERSNMKIS